MDRLATLRIVLIGTSEYIYIYMFIYNYLLIITLLLTKCGFKSVPFELKMLFVYYAIIFRKLIAIFRQC